ncbi:type IV pilus assembly protein PilM [Heliobacterium chlorum]|uniref:Type IV pilus assembly protein PilM n=1 Tax=Heliobacterium chlorum TaxID=2698 RepID=A0ABR7T2F8_HELCL|nr:type IV pilus assembly protein PilM [Heliobacterium chlorum]MBC9784952.1 type IV pilus assembly protein PilM [Heliobacterium chlorum]
MPFWKTSGAVGVDMDMSAIRVIALKGKSSKPELLHVGRIPIPEDAVREGVVQDVSMVAEVLHDYWDENKLPRDNVVLGLANNSLRIRIASFPKVPLDKLAKMIRYQAEDFFPIPLQQLVLDFSVVGETTGERGTMVNVLLVAARQEELNKSIQTMTNAGLTPDIVDPSLFALTRLIPPEAGSYVLVDIAYGVAGILLVDNHIPRICRVIPYGIITYAEGLGRPLEQVFVATSSSSKAEHTDRGNATAVDDEWALILANELRTTIGYYSNQPGSGSINKIYLSGPGTRIRGVKEVIAEDLELPVDVLSPFQQMNLDSTMWLTDPSEEREFAAAFGLALRGLEG